MATFKLCEEEEPTRSGFYTAYGSTPAPMRLFWNDEEGWWEFPLAHPEDQPEVMEGVVAWAEEVVQ